MSQKPKKPAPTLRKAKPTSAPRNPIKTDTRPSQAAIGRPRETTEPKRDMNFKIEKSVADRFDDLAEAHRKKMDGRKHGAGKDFLVHLIETYSAK